MGKGYPIIWSRPDIYTKSKSIAYNAAAAIPEELQNSFLWLLL